MNVRASLADQGLAIGVGANLPSPAGAPLTTLLALRPLLEQALQAPQAPWAGARPQPLQLYWSPLYRTAPVGGPPDQPDYLNAVLLVQGTAAASEPAALQLLEQLQALEQHFQRRRLVRWGPRSLDLDLLWWDGLQLEQPRLQLPHPRWRQRGFVLEPLRAIQSRWPAVLPWPLPPPDPADQLERLPAGSGWPE